MALRSGREFLSIPGPTTVPDQVLAAMQRPAVDIYSRPLAQLTDSLADLQKIFRTKHPCYIYITNGHGAWEACLTNVLSKGRQGAGARKRPLRARLRRMTPLDRRKW